ncbi:FecCD family ABC transporter permease [Saccharothrix deserti]|uniref:FecCD family ABC transporter permease n=1 Tax=Saccharothrix deserti TaxID=2593674 RepID=UPI00131E3301|nr:iron chelate uptake ABC transporter family permease subunit [Saccharothrix deserti]
MTGSTGSTGFRLGPVSGPLRWRPFVVVVVGLGLLVLAAAVSVARGDFPIPLGQVFDVLLGGGQRGQRFIVLDLRLPRALTGLFVGAALGVAGAVFQSIARNPLASPDILGVTWGAGAGAVSVITFAGTLGAVDGTMARVGVPLASLAGGLLAGLLVYGLAWRRGIEGFRLVLVGIGISAVAGNFTHYLLTVGDVTDAARVMVWITGSLNGRGWEHVVPVGLALALLIPAALVGTRLLGALQFDDDTVRGLGVRLNGARSVMLLLAVVLAAVATAAAGPVAFVALASPQIALRLAGTATPPLLGSAVVGGLLVVVSDLVARLAFGGFELPVGVVTAVLGAPYLMYLLVRSRREARV